MSAKKRYNFLLINVLMLCLIFSGNVYAALPKDVQADKYKLLISKSLKAEKYRDALKYIAKLESLKVKTPASIIFFKGESLLRTLNYDQSKKVLEEYIIRTGGKGRYYKKTLELLGELDDDSWSNNGMRRAWGTKLNLAVAQKRMYRVKKYLVEGNYDLNRPAGGAGFTPLGIASSGGSLLIAKELINHGVNVNSHYTDDDITSLHSASRAGHLKIIDLLIQNGANINSLSKNGSVPLHYAIHLREYFDAKTYKLKKRKALDNKELMTIKTLIDKGADLNIKDNSGNTTLDLAIKINANKAISLLKKHGAKRGIEL